MTTIVKTKFTNVRLTVDADIENQFLYDENPEAIKQSLLNEFVKVKSGGYENICMGNVVEVQVLGEVERDVEWDGDGPDAAEDENETNS